MRSLRVTTGAAPTAVDLGSEADITSGGARSDSAGYGAESDATGMVNKGWWYSLKGYVRAPMRLSYGPKDDKSPGSELHSPPRVPGQNSSDWNYLALASNPDVNLYVTVGNSRVSANVIMSANQLWDAGFMDLDQLGGINQAYVTLKFPEVFGNRGGIAATVGTFSMRYGNAGPGERSSGYYGTYLFGRFHTTGEDLTADLDINDHLELTLEHGIGGMIDIVPYNVLQQKNGFLPTQTNPEADTFVHHAHASLAYDDWMRIGLHYLYCWTPGNVPQTASSLNLPPTPNNPGHMSSMGADLHLDGLDMGSGFIGYSHVSVVNGNDLGPALQVVHGTSGSGFRSVYLGRKDPVTNATPTNNSGTVDTVLFQWIFRLSRIFGRAPIGRETTLGVYGMYNYVHSPSLHNPPVGRDARPPGTDEIIHEHKFKGGIEMEVQAHKYLNVGLRVDRVQPSIFDRDPTYWANIAYNSTGPNAVTSGSDAFTALSPRLIIHTNWKSKELIVVDYTHYFLGGRAYVGSPYSTVLKTDANMLAITLLFSF
jgi:hypothetical protein